MVYVNELLTDKQKLILDEAIVSKSHGLLKNVWSYNGTMLGVDHGDESRPGILHDLATLKEANLKKQQEKNDKLERPSRSPAQNKDEKRRPPENDKKHHSRSRSPPRSRRSPDRKKDYSKPSKTSVSSSFWSPVPPIS